MRIGNMRRLGRLLAGAALAATLSLPGVGRAGEAGDVVFADRGPWKLDRPLVWTVTHDGPSAPGQPRAARESVSIVEAIDPADGKPVLQLERKMDARQHTLGPFPVSGGDPLVVFFLENVTRDMAALTGGSPFYIRNRIKDALFRGGEVMRDEGRTVAVFRPFAGDPNRDRMHGFETLEIRFVAGPDPRRPLRALVAETSAPVAVAPAPGTAPAAPAPWRTAMVLE